METKTRYRGISARPNPKTQTDNKKARTARLWGENTDKFRSYQIIVGVLAVLVISIFILLIVQ